MPSLTLKSKFGGFYLSQGKKLSKTLSLDSGSKKLHVPGIDIVSEHIQIFRKAKVTKIPAWRASESGNLHIVKLYRVYF